MRILVACPKVPGATTGADIFSGAGRRALRQARLFARMGHQVILLTTTQDPLPEQDLEVICLPSALSWVQPRPGRPLRKVWDAWRGMRHCRRLLRQYRPDVVLTLSMGLLSMQLIRAGNLAGVPVLMGTTLLGSDDLLTLKRGRFGKARWWLLRQAAGIINLTPALQQAGVEAGYPPQRLHLIPNGVDCQRFMPLDPAAKRMLRERLGLNPEQFILVSIGAIIERKGMLALVEAFISAAPALPDPCLVLVGPEPQSGADGAYPQRIRTAAARAGLGDRILLVGEVPDSAPWLQAADAFVFNSNAEGFPSALIEAMAADLPIAVRRLPGTTDFIVEESSTTRLVSADDQWPNALKWLKTASGGSRAKAKANFSTERVTARYLELFRQVRDASVRDPACGRLLDQHGQN